MRSCLKIIYFSLNNGNQNSMRIVILYEWYTFLLWILVLLFFWFLKCNFLNVKNYLSWKYFNTDIWYNGKTNLRLESLRNRVLEPKKCRQIWINMSYLTDSYIGFTLKIESVTKNIFFLLNLWFWAFLWSKGK